MDAWAHENNVVSPPFESRRPRRARSCFSLCANETPSRVPCTVPCAAARLARRLAHELPVWNSIRCDERCRCSELLGTREGGA